MKKLAVLLLLPVLTLGCGKKNSADFTSSGGKYTVTAQDSVTIKQGEQTRFEIKVSNKAAMVQPMKITMVDPPKGITLTGDTTIPPSQESFMLTMNASPDAEIVSGKKLKLQGTSGEQTKDFTTMLTVDKSKETMVQEQQDFVKSATERFNTLQKKTAEMAKPLTDPKIKLDEKLKLINKMKDLGAQEKRVKDQLEKVEKATVEEWENLKQPLTEMLDALEKKLKSTEEAK